MPNGHIASVSLFQFQLIQALLHHIQRRGPIGGLYTIFRVLIGAHL